MDLLAHSLLTDSNITVLINDNKDPMNYFKRMEKDIVIVKNVNDKFGGNRKQFRANVQYSAQ